MICRPAVRGAAGLHLSSLWQWQGSKALLEAGPGGGVRTMAFSG